MNATMTTDATQFYDNVSARYSNVDLPTIEIALLSVGIFMMMCYIAFRCAYCKYYSDRDIDDIYTYIYDIEEQLSDLKATVRRLKKTHQL